MSHIWFYEETRKIIYSEDLIYEVCLYVFYPTTSLFRIHYQSSRFCQDITIAFKSKDSLRYSTDMEVLDHV